MRTSFFSSSNNTAEALKGDCRSLANDSLKTARHLAEPAIDAAQKAGKYARHAFEDARKQLKEPMSLAEKFASQQLDRTGHWVSSNPFKAVGIALLAGLVISNIFEHSSRR